MNNYYRKDLERVCNIALREAHNLSSTLQDCEGLFPTLAMDMFRSIAPDKTEELISKWNETTSCLYAHQKESSSYILSSWEFSEESMESVALRAFDASDRVGLLGVPSLINLLPEASDETPHLIVDLRTPNLGKRQDIQYLNYDINMLSGGEFYGAFSSCILDPPWYLENYIKWIDVARCYCKNGGKIVFPLLGRLTRPSAASDRRKILEHCDSIGLDVSVYSEDVLYKIPTFERHMMKRAGIPPVQWKRADILVCTCRRDADYQKPKGLLARPVAPFAQAAVFGVTFEIVFDRYNRDREEDLLIPQGGWWMRTPSRREVGMKDCNVFTSNGARFIATRPVDFLAKLLLVNELDEFRAKQMLRRVGLPDEVFSDVGRYTEAELLEPY